MNVEANRRQAEARVTPLQVEEPGHPEGSEAPKPRRHVTRTEAMVDAILMSTFPASDPPPWNIGPIEQ